MNTGLPLTTSSADPRSSPLDSNESYTQRFQPVFPETSSAGFSYNPQQQSYVQASQTHSVHIDRKPLTLYYPQNRSLSYESESSARYTNYGREQQAALPQIIPADPQAPFPPPASGQFAVQRHGAGTDPFPPAIPSNFALPEQIAKVCGHLGACACAQSISADGISPVPTGYQGNLWIVRVPYFSYLCLSNAMLILTAERQSSSASGHSPRSSKRRHGESSGFCK